jgi:hypothetical protein
MEIVSALFTIIILAIMVQTVTDILKKVIPIESIGKMPLPPVIALVVGIGLAVLTRTDILVATGFTPQVEAVGWVITGIVASGGATAVHEVIAKIRDSRELIAKIGENRSDNTGS